MTGDVVTSAHRKTGMTRAELLALPTAVDLVTAADAIGISRTLAYKMAKRDEFPVQVLRISNSYRVPTGPLLRYLGIETDESDHTDDTPHPTSNGEAGNRRPVSRVLDFTAAPEPTKMINRRGRVKLIYPDEMYRVDGEKVSGAEIIARGYIHPEARA
jgi:hypothetical protein